MTVITPDYCAPRSKASTGAILDALDVTGKLEWMPGFGGVGYTHCNQATKAACDALGVPLPAMLANDLADWLATLGKAAGWAGCDASHAGRNAEAGLPVLASLLEPGRHGHLCVVRGFDADGGLVVWSAGQYNFNAAPIRQVFTIEQLTRTRYFSHG